MKINNILFCSVIGAIGGYISAMFGGWTNDLFVLIGFMTLDYITGIAAGMIGKSQKTSSGALNSRIMFVGFLKKLFTLLLIAMAHGLDVVLELDSAIRTAAIIAFIANEGFSILENAGLIGIPLPKILTKMLDVLKDKGEEPVDEIKRD